MMPAFGRERITIVNVNVSISAGSGNIIGH